MQKTMVLIAGMAFSIGVPAAEEQTFYGSIGTGAYQLETEGFDDTAVTMSLTGGYNFNRNIAVEGTYSRLFEASDTFSGVNVDIDGNVWDLSTKLSYPLAGRLSPYGRIGWSYADFGATASDGVTTEKLNAYDDAFSWAVGAGYRLSQRMELSGEFSRVDFDDVDLDRVTVNLSYRFGSH